MWVGRDTLATGGRHLPNVPAVKDLRRSAALLRPGRWAFPASGVSSTAGPESSRAGSMRGKGCGGFSCLAREGPWKLDTD